jgi:hypothetical protein
MKVAGLDAVVFLRLLKYGLLLFAFATFWCCALLMPINATVRRGGAPGPGMSAAEGGGGGGRACAPSRGLHRAVPRSSPAPPPQT